VKTQKFLDPSESFPAVDRDLPIVVEALGGDEFELLDPEFETMGPEEFDDLYAFVTGSRPQDRFVGCPS
jgi:hypothetical protein